MRLAPQGRTSYRNLLIEALEWIEYVSISDEIIAIAAQPFPFVIKSLDAVHLATALDWRRREKKNSSS